jgi:hypothetical protein
VVIQSPRDLKKLKNYKGVLMKVFMSLIITLMGLTTYAQEKSRIALDCEAVEISSSEFEEAFSVDEYPQVVVRAIDKSNPMLPAISEEFTVSIGANRAYRAGQDGVLSIRNKSEGQGHQKYVVAFDDGKMIYIEAQHLGQASLSSSDGGLEATLRCN